MRDTEITDEEVEKLYTRLDSEAEAAGYLSLIHI